MSEFERTPSTSELQSQVDSLQESLDAARVRITELRDRNDEHITNWRKRLNASDAKSARRLAFLTTALNDAYGDKDKLDHTHSDIQRLILGALRVAKLRGLLSDGNAIADALDASEVWGSVKEDLTYDATGLSSDVIRERVANEVDDTMRFLTFHPRDPRFSEVWERATRLAQENDLCNEYDTIAGEFDIPTDHLLEYDGYVNVEFRGSASIPVSGTATRRDIQDGDIAYGNIDSSDVLEHADIYSLDWSVEETDVSIS